MIHGVEEPCKHAFFVAVGETASETAFGAFIVIQFFERVEETTRPPLASSHLVPGLKDDEGVGRDRA